MEMVESLQRVWRTWDVRGFLLFSFSLQMILILIASMRKRSSNKMLIGLVWLAYLLADWAGYYAIGLIPTVTSSANKDDSDLHAFWAPFLLLHLGGPITIAGFSLEDNEMWRRSVLHLVGQTSVTLFVIYRAVIVPGYNNHLLAPTLLIFTAAFTRYLERVLALYRASMDKFRDWAAEDSNYGKDFGSLANRNNPSEVEIGRDSYILFKTYKRVFGDLPIKFNENLDQTRTYLLKSLEPREAFTVMEIQMSLAYDLFYTKTWFMIETKLGRILHTVSLCSELTALVLWAFSVTEKKYEYSNPIDVQLTNTLAVGALVVHIVSLIKLSFSDIMIPRLAKWVGNDHCLILNKVLFLRRYYWLWSRWSGFLPQFNLLNDFILKGCVREKSNTVSRLLGNPIRPVRTERLSEAVMTRIFNRIKDTVKEAGSSFINLGDYMKKEHKWGEISYILNRAELIDSLLMCHLATELLCKKDENYKSGITKQVSEYLLSHLYDDESPMIAPAGVVKRVLFDEPTCKHIKDEYETQVKRKFATVSVSFDVNEFSKVIQEVIDTGGGNANTRESMLKYAHYINEHLTSLPKDEAVKIMEDIWVELLCNAAIRCTRRAHLERLSNGGELLTIVWFFLMSVGLINNYTLSVGIEITQEDPGKLVGQPENADQNPIQTVVKMDGYVDQ